MDITIESITYEGKEYIDKAHLFEVLRRCAEVANINECCKITLLYITDQLQNGKVVEK